MSSGQSGNTVGGRASPKQHWVCPSDRQLALRAKLQTGWSVKSHAMETYSGRQQPMTLDKAEQDSILEVIRRAEVIDQMEQERVGKLKERLDNMKKNAVGSGINQCILCGAQCILFGMLGSGSILCQDCKKAVCQKCGVETVATTKKESVWRCKICAETREMWKKSGAWFFKAFPKHILPTKKPQENKFTGVRRPGYDANGTRMRTPELDEESSSDEDRATRMLALRTKRPVQYTSTSSSTNTSTSSHHTSLWHSTMSSSFEKKSPGGRSSSTGPLTGDSLHSVDSKKSDASKKGQIYKFDMSEGSESSTSTGLPKPHNNCYRAQSLSDSQSYNRIPLPHAHSSISYNEDQIAALESENGLAQMSFACSLEDSQLSLAYCSESDRGSVSSSSASGYRTGTTAADEASDDNAETHCDGSMGSLEITLLYDSMASSIHVSLQRAKNLKPMDINGLADPFCKLNLLPPGTKSHRLRTRTVHKTRDPEFNEVLTFYGVTDTDLATRALHVIVLDDDKYGHDFMGEARYPLDRLRPDIARQLSFFLEKHYPVENEEFVWGEESLSHGQILITLCFSTKRKALVVGIAKCTNLTPMDNNGFSDPFVKLYLKPDPYHKKYKTSVKWKNLNPVFNEEFAFETKMTDLPQQTLVVTVWDKDYGKSNDYLGCLELGCISKGERLRHWVDMIKFPDHKHEGWHSLCEELPPQ